VYFVIDQQTKTQPHMRYTILVLVVAAIIIVATLSTTSDAALNWVNCTLVSPTGPTPPQPDAQYKAECVQVDVPLKWDDASETRTIKFFVKRVLSRVPSKRIGQLWLLTGGPGGNGATWEPYVKAIMEHLDDQYDVYLPDQRGTGRSSRLECTAETALASQFLYNADDLNECLQQSLNSEFGTNGGLQGYSTTNSAKDVKFVMDQISGKRVIYGVSYGTFFLNRILTLYGNYVDVAVADSVVTPPEFAFDKSEEFVIMAGEKMLEDCAQDDFCSGLFRNAQQGWTVRNAFRKAFDRQGSSNPCVPDFSPTKLKFLCGWTVGQFVYNKLVIPSIYRINRCNDSDKKFLTQYLGPVAASLAVAQPIVTNYVQHARRSISDDTAGPNIVRELWRNIAASEMSTFPRSQMDTFKEGVNLFNHIPSYFGQNSTAMMVNNILSRGDNIYYEPLRTKMALGYTNPMLSVHGTFDSLTPIQTTIPWRLRYNRPNQFFQVYSGMGHGIFANAFNLVNNQYQNCGWKIMADFILNPNQAPHPTCADTLVDSPRFAYDVATTPLDTWLAGYNLTLFGDLSSSSSRKLVFDAASASVVPTVSLFTVVMCFIVVVFMAV
jgi:pimeloyl-ACP methyl ester carboxylesterase